MFKKNLLVTLTMAGLLFIAGSIGVQAQEPASPLGCNADRSVVNIARSVASASVGETITFTIEAGNPVSDVDDGCDITERTMTLTLPNGETEMFGPIDYPYPSPLTIVGSAEYVASLADLSGSSWTATVAWTGVQKDGFDSISTGSKGTSVNYVPVALAVTKTALPVFDRTVTWAIDKTVDTAEHNLSVGGTGLSGYTVAIDKTTLDANYGVSGVITISNPALVPATVTAVTDVISGVGAVVVDCPVTLPHVLAAGGELVCTYTHDLSDNAPRINTATVTTTGDVEGAFAEANISFAEVTPTVVGFDEVTISDTASEFAGPITTSDDVVFEYDVSFMCGADAGVYLNTATIIETEQQADASVTINCANPAIAIEKATNGEDADTPTGPMIAVGDPVNWTYVVTNTGDVALTDIVVTDDQGVIVTCPQTTLAVDASMECTAAGVAAAGQYANLGSVAGYYEDVLVSDTDPSHYFGEAVVVQYCSPGYWKQSQHFGNWSGFSPDQSFSSVFGETITVMWSQKGKPAPVVDPTLLQALQANGGGINMLSRATVGALLNAAILDTTLSTDEVIAAFQNAYPGTQSAYQALAGIYTTEHNCPLGN